MFESLQRSWELVTESLSVLARDKRLLLFPVLSAVATILVSLTFLMPLFASGTIERLQLRDSLRHGDSVTYLVLFLFYYVNYFVVVFFNSALVASAGLYLAGTQPTLNDGLRAAGNRLGRIAYWVFIASTVGFLLRAIQRRAGRIGRLASGLFGVAWSLVTYFIVPVIIFENRPLFDSIDRSVMLFRKAWGEEMAGGIGFGFVWVLASIPGFLVLFASSRSHSLPGTVLAIFYFLLLATVASAAKGIFTAALYRYAAHADAPGGFSADMLRIAFLPEGGGTSLRPASVDTQPVIKASLKDVELISTEDRDTYLIRVQAGAAGYCGSYPVRPSDPGFRPDSWQPGTPLNLRIHGDWLLISGPGSHELWCHFLPDGPAQASQES